jgi:cytidylate kinase
MRFKHYVMVSAAVLAAGAGAGAAIAATTGNDDHKKAEQSILDDAAKRLNVTPEALRNALGAAEDAQLDQAVKDGKLTQAQADAIKKARRQSGTVLGGPGGPGRHGGPGFGPGGPGFGLRLDKGGALDAAATALGLKLDDLLAKVRAGQSIAAIAKAQGKSLDDVKAAMTAAVTKELDQAVADKQLTSAQRDQMLAAFKDRLDEMVARSGGPGVGPRGAGGPGLAFKLGKGGALDAAATALGLKVDDLLTKVSAGQSVADIAKAQGKSLDDVKAAVTAEVTKELDRAVADKQLTSAQRDQVLSELKAHLDDLLTRSLPNGMAGAAHGLPGFWR